MHLGWFRAVTPLFPKSYTPRASHVCDIYVAKKRGIYLQVSRVAQTIVRDVITFVLLFSRPYNCMLSF